MIDIYSAFPLVSSVLLVFLGFFIFSKNRKNTNSSLFLLICLAILLWQFSFFALFTLDDVFWILFFSKLCFLGITLIPFFFFYFVCLIIYPKNEIKKTDKYILYFSLLLTVLFEAILVFSDFFINGYNEFYFGFIPRAGFIHPIFLFYLAIIVLRMLYVLYFNLRNNVGHKKEQIKYLLVATIFLSCSSVDFFFNYNINLIYPLGFSFILLFIITIAYAIVARGFMDIKLALRKSSVYIASIVSTLIPAFVIKYLINRYLPYLSYWTDFLLIIIAVSLFPYLKDRFFNIANKYLFASLYDSKKLIGVLTNSLSATIEENDIHKILVTSLQNAFHMKSIAVMNYDKERDIFFTKHNVGFDLKFNQEIKINKKLINSYILKDNIIVIEELKTTSFGVYRQLINLSNKLGIKVIAPMTLESKVVGIILLGEKESGDSYNKEDLEVIDIIDSQMAISLENAILYSRTKEFNNKLKREVETATKDLRSANMELKKLDKAKSEFISIASHQLRTPLTVVKGYGSMILDGTFGDMDPKVKENIIKIYDSNERLIGLVEDLLNVSRIESGRLKFEFEDDQLDDIVASVVEELTPNAKAKDLYLNFEKPKSFPSLKLDRRKIRQVIVNIIDNSIKYTKRGGATIKLEVVNNIVRFSVVDTGMGISSADLPNLFKKFSRGEDTSLVHTEGTGLGLYVGKQMVEAHGGKVWIESEGVGKGAQFYFEIPINNIPNPPKAPVKENKKKIDKKDIK